MNKKKLAVIGVIVLAVVVGLLVFWLAQSGGRSDAPEFPPTEETVQAAAEKVGWTLDSEATQSRTDQAIYTFETGDQTRVYASCTSVDGDRVMAVYDIVVLLPDKPEFAWEDWKKAVTLAETLYGLDEGELYQALSQQDMPQPVIPEAGADTPVGKESLGWEVELPSGYGKAGWSISAGEVEHGFPEPTVKNWREDFVITLYESKDAYESMGNKGTAPLAEHAAVVFDSGMKSGTATQEVRVGEHAAAITVGFDYDFQGDARVITGIGDARAENRAGWHHVGSAVTIDRDKIIYANEGAKAVVPVTYQASIGAGYASYDNTVVIDLSAE